MQLHCVSSKCCILAAVPLPPPLNIPVLFRAPRGRPRRWLVPRGARVRELDLAVVPTPGAVELRAWRLVLRALAAVAPSCERLHLVRQEGRVGRREGSRAMVARERRVGMSAEAARRIAPCVLRLCNRYRRNSSRAPRLPSPTPACRPPAAVGVGGAAGGGALGGAHAAATPG